MLTKANPDGNISLKQLWKGIYEQERVASRMPEIAAKTEGITFHLDGYGTVQLLVKPASAIGDNYMSDTYYNTAVLSSGIQHKAFVKVLPSNPLLRAGAKNFQVYNREIASYTHWHPLLRQIRDEAGLTSEELSLDVPEIYYTCLDDTKGADNLTVVIMEELSSQGFVMVDKHVCCSVEEAKMTLGALANFHALSFMMLKRYKNADESYSLPSTVDYVLHPHDFKKVVIPILSSKVPLYIKMIRHFGHEKAANWLEEQMKRLDELHTPKNISEIGPLALICHGDIWNNNILYRYDETTGKLKDVRLVDWQIITPDNPGRDVFHFLNSSTTPDVRRESGQEMVDHYITTLLSALEKLGLPLEEEGFDHQFVKAEINKKLLSGMFTGLLYLPGMLEKNMTAEIQEKAQDKAIVAAAESADTDVFNVGESGMTWDILLRNQVLCHRLIDLVEETKQQLE